MTREEFIRISGYLKSRCGINMTEKQEIVEGRMKNYLHSHGYKNHTEYMDAVERDESGKLEKELVNLLTTNHTYFMREFEHFDFLRQEVLPYLREKEARSRDLRIWCGAASSGEEPYMLAMLIKDFFGLEHDKWDTKVLATDIDTNVLARAVEGVYSADQIAKLPEPWKRRFLHKIRNQDKYEIVPELKQEVIFRKFNLMDPFPFRKKLHVVLLRNVMIYFDKATKEALIRKVYDSMEPGGYFFVGRTETIDKCNVPFKMLQPSIFRK